jgi:hypothetical protein
MTDTHSRYSRHGLRLALLAAALGTVLHGPVALAHPGGPGGSPGPQPHHGGPGPHAPLPVLPGPALTILFAGLTYSFVEGLFYLPGAGGFTVVVPPVGLVVPVLPPAYTVVMVGPRTYYHAQGVYYVRAAEGYTVVQPPVAQNTQTQATQPSSLPDTVTVVVENPNGSRTPVTLTRTADGWQGPKGELYDTIPTQEQLRPYYGLTAGAQGQTL